MKNIILFSLFLTLFFACKKDPKKPSSTSSNNSNNPISSDTVFNHDDVVFEFSQYSILSETEFGETYHQIVFIQNVDNYSLEINEDDELVLLEGAFLDIEFIIDGDDMDLIDSVYIIDESVFVDFLFLDKNLSANNGTIEVLNNRTSLRFDVVLSDSKKLTGTLVFPSKKLSEIEYESLIKQILSNSGLTMDDLPQDDEVMVEI